MALFGRRSQPALVASAARMKRRQGAIRNQSPEGWQKTALDFSASIGELRFSSEFYARQLSRVRFHPARLEPDGQKEEIESGLPVDLLNRIQDPGGGRSRLQYDYGRLMFITGEGVLFGDRLDSPLERWRFLWREEVEFTDGGEVVRKDIDGKRTNEVGVGYRLWTPSPSHSDMADSPMRAVLDIAAELQILTASVRGTAVTRLTNGLLLLPTEIMPPSPDSETNDEDPEQNPFMRQLIEHMESQIEFPDQASSKIPFVVAAAYEYLDRAQWLKLHDPESDFLERDLRIEAIKRLALGLDMPPEALLGMTDANHWTAKQVQQDMWKSHGIPRAEQFADDLAEAYLRPALAAEEFSDWENVVIGFDDSEVVASPDRTEDADNALDRAAISYEAYLELKGIRPDMKAGPEDIARVMALKNRTPAMDGEVGARGPVPELNGKTDPSSGPPPPKPGRMVSRQEARTASIMGAAAMAIRNCRAKAGARLRSGLDDRCPECHQQTDGLPNSVVASALGQELLEEMEKRNPLALVKGGTDEFRGILEEWGIEPIQAEGACLRLESYAAATLFEERQPEIPPGFLAYIEDVKGEDDDH